MGVPANTLILARLTCFYVVHSRDASSECTTSKQVSPAKCVIIKVC